MVSTFLIDIVLEIPEEGALRFCFRVGCCTLCMTFFCWIGGSSPCHRFVRLGRLNKISSRLCRSGIGPCTLARSATRNRTLFLLLWRAICNPQTTCGAVELRSLKCSALCVLFTQAMAKGKKLINDPNGKKSEGSGLAWLIPHIARSWLWMNRSRRRVPLLVLVHSDDGNRRFHSCRISEYRSSLSYLLFCSLMPSFHWILFLSIVHLWTESFLRLILSSQLHELLVAEFLFATQWLWRLVDVQLGCGDRKPRKVVLRPKQGFGKHKRV